MHARVSVSWRILSTHYRLRKHIPSRNLSSDAKYVESEDKAHSNTLLLPKTPFKLQPDPRAVEKTYRGLTCDELYRWQVRVSLSLVHGNDLIFSQWENAQGPLFVLLDGPPYANGDLHMGAFWDVYSSSIIS